ncbi:Autotransporter domain-containing protein [Pseudomonas zeae]
MTGSGSVEMGGASIGNMTLAGNNSGFSGLLTVNTGTTLDLQTDLGSGKLNLLGDVAFNHKYDLAVTGVISGIGSVDINSNKELTLSGVNSYTGATSISSGSSLVLSGAGSIAQSSTVQLAEGASLTVNDTANGASVNNLAGHGGSQILLGDKTLTVHSGSDTVFNGTLKGGGGLTKEGLGTLTLTGHTLQTGVTALNAGTLVLDGTLAGATLASDVIGSAGASLLLRNGAVLTGAFSGADTSSHSSLLRTPAPGSASLNLADSVWNLTGSSAVDTLTLANSSIHFTNAKKADGAPYSTLSVNNIASQNSVIQMQGGSTGSDKIEIDGGSFTGHAILDYSLSSALSQPSTVLVDALNGATTSSDAFSLARPVYYGQNEYVLNQGSATSSESWVLNKTNSYRPELIVDSALTSTATGYVDALIAGVNNTLSSKRLGLLLGKSDNSSLVWVTGVGSSVRENPNRHSKTDSSYRATVLGADFGVELDADNSARLGFFAAMGKGKSSFSNRHTKQNAGSSAADTYTVGLYGLGDFGNGFYLDPVLHHSWLKSLKTNYASGLGTETKASSWGFSVEGGKHIDMGHNFTIAPHLNLDYQQLHMQGVQANYADVKFDRVKNIDVGAGLNISKNIPFDAGRSVSVYAAPTIKHRISSNGDTKYSWLDGAPDFATKNDTKGTSFPLTFGAIGHPSKDVAVGVAMDYEASGKSTAVSGTATLTVSF